MVPNIKYGLLRYEHKEREQIRFNIIFVMAQLKNINNI